MAVLEYEGKDYVGKYYPADKKFVFQQPPTDFDIMDLDGERVRITDGPTDLGEMVVCGVSKKDVFLK